MAAGTFERDDPPPDREETVRSFLGSTSVLASVVTTIVTETLERVSGESALSLSHLRFLDVIAHEAGTNVTEIARSVGISKAAVSRNVDRLVELGLIARCPGREDRRTVELDLTAAGDAILRRYAERLEATLLQHLAAEPPGTLRGITAALDRMTAALIDAQPGNPPPCGGCMACNLFRRTDCPLGRDQQYAACHHEPR